MIGSRVPRGDTFKTIIKVQIFITLAFVNAIQFLTLTHEACVSLCLITVKTPPLSPHNRHIPKNRYMPLSLQRSTQHQYPTLIHTPHPSLAQICDFGLARVSESDVRQRMTQEVVTQYYRAPEVLMGAKHYTSAVDMWCVGGFNRYVLIGFILGFVVGFYALIGGA